MSDRSRWNVQYMQRVLATDPIAYWIQDEKSGTVAYDWVTARSNGAQNGAYTGVTLGQPGIGDGRTSPFYDALNDYTNCLTPAFIAAFNGSELTLSCWTRMFNVGVWTDGIRRFAVHLLVDGNNRVYLFKDIVNNVLEWNYTSGSVANTRQRAAVATTDWFHMGLTVSKTTNEVRAYYQGVQEGATMGGLGVWAGALIRAIIGADIATPLRVWHGWEAHVAVWNRALPPAAMADLARL